MKFTWFHRINARHITIVMCLLSVAISMQCYFAHGNGGYTRYNNYVIFKNSFLHLLENKNLYTLYINEVYDLFKYSPTFAVLMAPFYYLPDFIGLPLFNLLNVGVFLYALSKLKIDPKRYKYLLLFLFIEVGISLTSTQTNLLMAGLIMLGFASLENNKIFLAAFCIALTVYIKLFGVVAFALWFLYPNKPKFLLYSIFWMVVLAALPLVVISMHQLVQQYQNWQALLKEDHDLSYGASFIGWMHSWFGLNISKIGTVAVGAVLFLLPFLKLRLYSIYLYRLHILASVLIWVIIFNHRAESSTYSIALTGVGLWYFSQKPVTFYRVLLILCLLLCSVSSTDLLTPGWIARKYIEPYSVKAVLPCIIWALLIWDILSERLIKRNGAIASTAKTRVASERFA